MKRLRRTVTTVLAAATAATVMACNVADTIEQRAAGEAAPQIPPLVDAQVLTWLDKKNAPGATVAVTVDGRLVFSKGYGVSDLDSGTQMQPWHRSRIGSVSKLITTIVVLQLMEQGTLDLDDPLYASSVTPLWGDDPDTPPILAYPPGGVLANPGDYLEALVTGVGELSKDVDLGDLYAPDEDGPPQPLPAYLVQDTYQENVELALDWASQITLRHVLSHTSGLLRNGSGNKAAEALGIDQDDLYYALTHQGMLMGAKGPPLRYEPGTGRKYSNHGFGLTGWIVDEVTGEPYEEHTQANVFTPVGLDDVVPHGIELGELDVTPYKSVDGNPVENPYQITGEYPGSTSTGGWVATAQDLARVACGLDEVSNHQRLLDRDTVDAMATIWFPDADGNQPLGWDKRTDSDVLTKSGKTDQGAARVSKFLPGSVSDVEVNVAVVTNLGKAPGEKLLRNIAEAVTEAPVPEDFDLFEDNPCYVPPDENLAQPSPGGDEPPDPSPEPDLAAPAPSTAAPSPPPKRDREPSPAPEPTRTAAPPPQVSDLTPRTEDIWTTFRDVTCGPTETAVRARVRSGNELQGVELEWAIGERTEPDRTGSVAMVENSSGYWSAPLGPFDLNALPEPASASPLTVSVVATDQLGGTGSAQTEITLHPCPPVAQ